MKCASSAFPGSFHVNKEEMSAKGFDKTLTPIKSMGK